MSKNFLLLCMMMIVSASFSDAAYARSTGSHKAAAGTYIHKTCKTKSCFKKHPEGSYGFYAGKKKK